MGSIPLPALDIRPPENPLDQYAKALSVKSMIEGQKTQQLQQQALSQNVQSGAIDLQMKNIGLKNAQITNTALSDPHLSDELSEWQQQKSSENGGEQTAPATSGSSTPLQLHPLAQFLAEKKGLPLMGPGGAMEISKNLTENAQQMATLLKTQGEATNQKLEGYSKQLDNLTDKAAPIFEEDDPAKQATALGTFKNDVLTNPDQYPPALVNKIQGVNTPGDLATLVNYGKMHQAVIDDATKLAQAQTDAAKAVQAGRAAAAPTFEQQSDAKNTLASYLAIPTSLRAGLAKEMANAPDFETLQKVQGRADAANESFQRSADARQQATAMKDVSVGQAMATQLIGEDKTLGTALDQTRGIRGLLDMTQNGNQTASQAAQVRFAEHEIVEGGVKRMNQTELSALTSGLGTYGRQFQAWADKGFTGKMPPATNADMQKILDAEDQAATAGHARNVGFIQNRFSDINNRNAAKAQTGMIRARDPAGVLHEAKAGTPLPAGWTPE